MVTRPLCTYPHQCPYLKTAKGMYSMPLYHRQRRCFQEQLLYRSYPQSFRGHSLPSQIFVEESLIYQLTTEWIDAVVRNHTNLLVAQLRIHLLCVRAYLGVQRLFVQPSNISSS